MEWLIAGLLIGYVLGRAKRAVPPDAVQLAANRLRTRFAAAVALAEKGLPVMVEVQAQARAGQVNVLLLAELINIVGDWTNVAGDMVDDHMALLKEVAHGRT
jgi:hypothetical protein